MRSWVVGIILVVASSAAAGAGALPASADDGGCASNGCGVPSCWEPSVRARPDMARLEHLQCVHVDSATIAGQPAHGVASDLALDPGEEDVSFTLKETADAPRNGDETILHLVGPEGAIDEHVPIEVIPTSENHAPVCTGDSVSMRTDGSAPAEVSLNPECYDPEGDEFTVDGSGPGTPLDAPESVGALRGGDGWWTSWDGPWRYRTATASGTETTTIHATDVLGARSADATLQVTIGPDVDRLPDCAPNPTYSDGSNVYPVYTRPGAVRRFGIICRDADGDPFTPSVSSPPQHGSIAAFDLGALWTGWYGAERWIDATYVPSDDSGASDDFDVTASGSHGDGTSTVEMFPREPPANGGGGCGWSPAAIVADTAGEIDLSCSDDDGDPLSAEVIGGADHGTAGAVAVVPATYGNQTIVVPYTPNGGYQGYDCVKVRISDGYGLQFDISVDINVAPPPPAPPAPVPPPPPPPPPPTPVPLGPPSGLGASSTPQAMIAAMSGAPQTLGTSRVQRFPGPQGARLAAPAHLSRTTLLGRRAAPGLLVACPVVCQLRSSVELAVRRRSGVRGRWGDVLTVAPDEAQLLWVALDRAQVRTLRRFHRATLVLSLRLRVAGGAPLVRRVSIPVS